MAAAKPKRERVKLIVSIVERRQGAPLAKLYTENGIPLHFQSSGVGTASSDLLDVLGFGTAERDVLFSLAAESAVDRLMFDLNNALRSSVRAKGIVFNLPLTALNQLIAVPLLQAEPTGKGAYKMGQKGTNSLILVVVNQGHTDQVMDTAKRAGARGGTILRARWVGAENSESFYGITLQAEKEIIAIVATAQTRNLIMESINREHGLDSEADAMLCSMGLDAVVRLN